MRVWGHWAGEIEVGGSVSVGDGLCGNGGVEAVRTVVEKGGKRRERSRSRSRRGGFEIESQSSLGWGQEVRDELGSDSDEDLRWVRAGRGVRDGGGRVGRVRLRGGGGGMNHDHFCCFVHGENLFSKL